MSLGHIFVARHFGIRTLHVTLLPIGGLASIERVPEKPSQEILIALADLSHVAQLEQVQSTFVGRLAAANMALFIFNLIPAFPMDGGRVLRSVLATFWGTRQRSDGGLDRPRRDLPVVADNAPLDRAFEMLRGSGAWDQKNRANACAGAMPLRAKQVKQ